MHNILHVSANHDAPSITFECVKNRHRRYSIGNLKEDYPVS